MKFRTLELEQEPNLGRTVLQKLEQEAGNCTLVMIAMTATFPAEILIANTKTG